MNQKFKKEEIFQRHTKQFYGYYAIKGRIKNFSFTHTVICDFYYDKENVLQNFLFNIFVGLILIMDILLCYPTLFTTHHLLLSFYTFSFVASLNSSGNLHFSSYFIM